MENKKLLESFYQLIGDFGYSNFGIEKLAQISGVDEEYIYEEYENKEKLLLEVMKYVYIKEKILIFEMDETKDIKKQIIEKGQMFLRLNKYDIHYSAFKNQVHLIALENEPINKALGEIMSQYVSLFSNMLNKIKDEYKIDNVENLAYEIYLLLDSLILYEKFEKKINPELIWIDFINRVFL